MSLEITKLPGEPIIVLYHVPPLQVPDDPVGVNKAVNDFKQEIGTHIYRIVDLSAIPLTFSDMMMGMKADMNLPGGINDENVSTLYVGQSEMVRFGAESFKNQQQYGKTNVLGFFRTQEEAIAAARADIASRK